MKAIAMSLLLLISVCGAQDEMPNYIIDAKNYNLIDAKKAFYVIESHKYGTMQENFAFASQEDAKQHVKKYGGKVMDYDSYEKMLLEKNKEAAQPK